jgi:hypothetical protein
MKWQSIHRNPIFFLSRSGSSSVKYTRTIRKTGGLLIEIRSSGFSKCRCPAQPRLFGFVKSSIFLSSRQTPELRGRVNLF